MVYTRVLEARGGDPFRVQVPAFALDVNPYRGTDPMKAITPYLTFDGNAGEAMKFYHECLGGEFQIQTFGESGAGGPPGSENRVMHARITIGKIMLMASDSMPGHNFVAGTNFSIALECED